jgi:chemotaxis protein histidine kinase CheA
LNVAAMMGLACSDSATTRPRVVTAPYDDFFAHLGWECCHLQLLHDHEEASAWTDNERQMNSIPNPKQTNPHDVAVAALKQAYEQFGRADEQLARGDEQVSKLEQDGAPHPSDPQQAYEQSGRADEELSNLLHDAARHLSDAQIRTGSDVPAGPPVPPADTTFRPSAVYDVLVPGQLWSIGRGAMRAFIALLLIGAAGIAWQSYGDAAKEMIAEWAPQLALTSSLPPENPGLAEQPAPPAVQADAATAPPQPAPLAQTAPEDVAPTAAALSPESAQLLQTMARDLATVGQEIEQLKTSQAQMARANADLAEQLKTSQAQMARANAELAEQLKAAQAQMARSIAKASEQNLRPKTSAPPPRPIATPARKPVPKLSSPQARAQPQAEPVSRPPTPLR